MSEPIINFNNRTLTVEGSNWYLEVRVLASGKQIAVHCSGTGPESNDLVIRPDTGNRVFISSQASEKEPDTQTDETPKKKVK